MAKQIQGVYQRLLQSAKEEFLAKGFKNASLRIIAQNANTSTGSIYTRFKDKEELFEAIVAPASDALKELICNIQETFHQLDGKIQQHVLHDYSSKSMQAVVNFIYDHFEEMQLLLDASYGTKFNSFIDELTEIEVDYNYKYMQVIGCESITSGAVTEDFLHMVVHSFIDGMFEVVRHRMKKEDAEKYIKMLRKYHNAGYDTIYNPQKY